MKSIFLGAQRNHYVGDVRVHDFDSSGQQCLMLEFWPNYRDQLHSYRTLSHQDLIKLRDFLNEITKTT